MIEIFPVPSAMAPDVVDRVEADIRAALEYGGDFDVDDVREMVAKRDWQIWIVTEAGRHAGVVITHVAIRPTAKVCEIVLLAGIDAKRWMGRAEDAVAGWARELGCVAMEAAGRLGWERRMAPKGWRRAAVVIRKELTNG